MVAGAGARIIISNPHNSQRICGIGRQFAQIHNLRSLGLGHIFNCNREILPDDFIHCSFNCSNLLLSGLCLQEIVAFALFPLYMGIS